MNVVEIVFSPTGGTGRTADIIGRHWSDHMVKIDLCDAGNDFSGYAIGEEDMVLIAMPSFAGRAPAAAIERLKRLKGNGARCTLVVNNTVVRATAVAEHSILPQYASGRPDPADEKQLEEFAEQIAGKTDAVSFLPGDRPYRKAGGAGLVPKPDKNCIRCGLCATKCPVQAIGPSDFKADAQKCISCMRCVKRCPAKARKVNGAMVSAAGLALKKACSTRKENELFL